MLLYVYQTWHIVYPYFFAKSVNKLNASSVGHGSISKSVGQARGSNSGFEVWMGGAGG